MSKVSGKPNLLSALGRVVAFVGAGLIIIGLLEAIGLINYRSHREPVGSFTWLMAGSILLAAGLLIGRKG